MIILRCLEVDPDTRHPSAAALVVDLREPTRIALTRARIASTGIRPPS